MKTTYTIARGQREFTGMVKQAEKGELAVVTRHDRPVAYLISAERMEGLLETMELLTNPEFVQILAADHRGTLAYHPLDTLADD